MADVLFIDGCMRGWEVSRTYAIAEKFIEAYKKSHPQDQVEEIHLTEVTFPCLTGHEVERNDALVANAKLNAIEFEAARRFAKADKILLAAPYWNMGLPAAVSAYFENICINEITFRMSQDGNFEGKCAAKKFLCIMTSGGEFGDDEDARSPVTHLRSLCGMLGIPEVTHLWIEGLDILDGDAQTRLSQGMNEAEEMAENW